MTTKEDIMKYVLDIIDVDESEAATLATAGITTPKSLLRASMENLRKLSADSILTPIQLDELLRFRQWMKSKKDKNETIPTSIDEWKNDFTVAVFEAFCDQEQVPTPPQAPAPTLPQLQVQQLNRQAPLQRN
ncbi:expressed unknown protein [Seminavis robusta]|uniref:Uncharacterized protein n=1 Tax=Seminavis robusta TaxID=568900 RepID=A0A9N8EI80_9STRA|nr:expressed unknown protein [Seminavis robusta]|eukprot:Sro1235_g254980.1 n/a (132) ;mRNA; r:6625-7020